MMNRNLADELLTQTIDKATQELDDWRQAFDSKPADAFETVLLRAGMTAAARLEVALDAQTALRNGARPESLVAAMRDWVEHAGNTTSMLVGARARAREDLIACLENSP